MRRIASWKFEQLLEINKRNWYQLGGFLFFRKTIDKAPMRSPRWLPVFRLFTLKYLMENLWISVKSNKEYSYETNAQNTWIIIIIMIFSTNNNFCLTFPSELWFPNGEIPTRLNLLHRYYQTGDRDRAESLLKIRKI